MTNIFIRQEEPRDYPQVYELVKEAFASAEHSDGNEQDLVEALRRGAAFVPELSLVAEVGGRLAGHILFTRASVNGEPVLALAPLAVLPEFRRQGVGQSLMAAGHQIAAGLGYPCSVVLGSERYYPKAGYVPASRYGIFPPFEVSDVNFMLLPLQENARIPEGILVYAKEFGL